MRRAAVRASISRSGGGEALIRRRPWWSRRSEAILAERVVATAHMELWGDGEHRPLLLVGPPGTSRLLMVLGEIDKAGCGVGTGPRPRRVLSRICHELRGDRQLARSDGRPLLDRCEVVEVAGLTVAERVQVAGSYRRLRQLADTLELGVTGLCGLGRGRVAGGGFRTGAPSPRAQGKGDTWAVSHQLIRIFEVAIGGTRPQAAG